MNEIVMANETVKDAAHNLHQKICEANYNLRSDFLLLAGLLCLMRDEKLYHALGCPTFESYLGSLGAEGTRSWLYKLMRAYDLFAVKLLVPSERLVEAGPTKLDIIAPVVNEGNKDEWLDKTILSKSDLINEVRQVQGKPILSSLPAQKGPINPGLSDLTSTYPSYLDYVRDQPCLVCGKHGEPHHWPVTRGAGGNEVDEWAIPLCRECHDEAHRQPHKFTHDYSHKWARYLYGLILKIWETA